MSYRPRSYTRKPSYSRKQTGLKMSQVLVLASGTFNSAEMQFPVLPTQEQGVFISRIDFWIDTDAMNVDGKYLELQLTYDEQADLILPNNGNLIAGQKWKTSLNTSGMVMLPQKFIELFQPNLLLVKDKIQFSGKQDSGAQMTVYCDVYYQVQKVSQMQAMNEILNQWGGA